MKEKKRPSPVDASRELIIDSIVLTTEVLNSIRNNLPVPLDHVILQRVEATTELDIGFDDPFSAQRVLMLASSIVLLAVLVTVL